jgi:hypothetical protein
MGWNVRVEAESNVSEVRAFLDGVTAALAARREPNLVVSETGSANRVEFEFSIKTRHRAETLAQTIATTIEPYCDSARVTLVMYLGEGRAS